METKHICIIVDNFVEAFKQGCRTIFSVYFQIYIYVSLSSAYLGIISFGELFSRLQINRPGSRHNVKFRELLIESISTLFHNISIFQQRDTEIDVNIISRLREYFTHQVLLRDLDIFHDLGFISRFRSCSKIQILFHNLDFVPGFDIIPQQVFHDLGFNPRFRFYSVVEILFWGFMIRSTT